MFRDKDYLLTADDLVFTVLGDQHAAGLVTAGLKYVRGEKWLYDYSQAVRFLQEHFPRYVSGNIVQVPVELIREHLKPRERAAALRETPPRPGSLLALAMELIDVLHQEFDIPREQFGLTDSLLWGEGTERSDIDLVIYGREPLLLFQAHAEQWFARPEFEPIGAEHIQRPPHLDEATFAKIVSRKHNQGTFRGTRFTIRGVWDDDEIVTTPERTTPFSPCGPVKLELEIANTEESLLYPIAYECRDGTRLVTYHIGYEMGFRPGDRVAVKGMRETGAAGERVVVGSVRGEEESVRLL